MTEQNSDLEPDFDPADDVIDIEPYEGEPDFKSSGVLNDSGTQDDREEVQDA